MSYACEGWQILFSLEEPFYEKSLQLLTNEQLTKNKKFEFSFGFDQSSPNILSRDLHATLFTHHYH